MKRKISIAIVATIIFILFAYISYLTPLAGDDWGYAINGLKGTPFATAFEFYFGWSGRFFSELWGFIVAPNKWLWNILNPVLFTAIFILIMKIIDAKRNNLIISLVVLFLMLSVKDQVRMETYTWIMGTGNYIVPLFLLLTVVYCYKKILIDCKPTSFLFIVIGVSSFIACLMMESVAGVLLIINVGVLIYSFIFERKKYVPYLIISLVTIIAFALLRLSPGATLRAQGEHSAWLALNIFDQIAINWPNLVKYTLLENKYLIAVLSTTFILHTFLIGYANNSNKILRISLGAIFSLSLIQSIGSFLYNIIKWDWLRILFEYDYYFADILLSSIFVLLIIAIITVLIIEKDIILRFKSVAVFSIAACANSAMILSPIFGSRSSLFTIYFIIVLVGIIVGEFKINSNMKIIVALVFVLTNAYFIRNYLSKYHLVAAIDKERMAQIEYYKDHPEVKEAWITRMPIMSIHSADVEEWDTYHMDMFKQYYGLNSDVNVIFAFKEKY